VEEFESVLENRTLPTEKYVGEFELPHASSIAVDNGGDGSDPSQGDVYVLSGKSANDLYKFSAKASRSANRSRGSV